MIFVSSSKYVAFKSKMKVVDKKTRASSGLKTKHFILWLYHALHTISRITVKS